MALVRANTSGGGGTPILDYDGYSDFIGSTATSSFTVSDDHDFVMVVSYGVTNTSGYIIYNGVTYNFKSNNTSDSSKQAGAILLPNVKDNTTFTFSGAYKFVGIYGLSYT